MSSSNNSLISDLFRGVGSLVLRQMVAWIYFLQADLYFKQKIRQYKNIPDKENIPSKYLIPASLMVAVISTVIIMPFDALKTHQQLFKKHGQKKEKYSEIVKSVYEKDGLRAFFVGWRIRFFIYCVHSLMTVDLLEKLEGIKKSMNTNE